MVFRFSPFPDSTIEADALAVSLLGSHFFPNQAVNIPETPPSITSTSFTRECAKALVSSVRLRSSGYDAVAYQLTRTNLTLRHAHIPHPTPYAHLVDCIERNWSSISHVVDNRRSVLRPMVHPDGRIFVFDGYGSTQEVKITQALEERFARRYVLKTDVKNLFPSIYSHSIPWALVGRSVAKANRNVKTAYYNELDLNIRMCKRQETNGVLIGPGTSNLAAEIVLGAVDRELEQGPHKQFHRFVDDYTYFASTLPDVDDFVRQLSSKLALYELNLNEAKTQVTELPTPLKPDWMTTLTLLQPSEGENTNRVLAFLDQAVSLSSKRRDSSILVHAMRVLIHTLSDQQALEVLPRPLLNLCFHRPRLIPLLDQLFKLDRDLITHHQSDLTTLAMEASISGRSDMASWCLHFLSMAAFDVADELIEQVVKSGDCIPLLIAYSSGQVSYETLVEFFAPLHEENDDYVLDQYWPLLYEMYLREPSSTTISDEAFKVLESHDVKFIDLDASEANYS